jgi:hypothetical protein
MDVVAKPVQPTASAVIWGEIKPHHIRKEKAAEETKILAMSKQKKRVSPENATNRTGYLINIVEFKPDAQIGVIDNIAFRFDIVDDSR